MSSIKEKIISAYTVLADKYNELIEHKPHNAYYDRPNTLALLPELQGKSVLDAGCGPGKYAEIMLAADASVTGIDFTPDMIGHAQRRNAGRGHFFVHDMTQPLHMLEDASFDIVLSALALDYIEDWNPTLQEFCRVLKPQGVLVISVEHPFFTWQYFKSEQYFEVEQVKCTWRGFGQPVEINNYRRSLGDILQPITDNGFYIDRLVEPKPVKAFEALDPRHYRELNAFPSFMCLRAIKK